MTKSLTVVSITGVGSPSFASFVRREPMPELYFECGCCGAYHPIDFYGDCRDDANRFNLEDLPEGWEEVSLYDE